MLCVSFLITSAASIRGPGDNRSPAGPTVGTDGAVEENARKAAGQDPSSASRSAASVTSLLSTPTVRWNQMTASSRRPAASSVSA